MDRPKNIENKRGAGSRVKSLVVDRFASRDLRELIGVIDCDRCVVQKGALSVILYSEATHLLFMW